jgi:HPt (histidine-containing phosphotransfer) domain-containing protein
MALDQFTDNESMRTGPFPYDPIVDDALNLASLGAFEEFQSDDGSDLIIELIDLYLLDAPKQILAIGKAAAVTQWVALKRAAHQLKGSSGAIGVSQVAVLCEELEGICEKLEATSCPDSSEAVAALVQVLEYKFAKARQALTTERQRRLN